MNIHTSKAFLRAFGAIARKAPRAYLDHLDAVLFNGAKVAATDGHRLLEATFPKPLTEEPVIFSGQSIRSAATAAGGGFGNVLDIAKSEVRTPKGTTVALNRVDLTYPPYHERIPTDDQKLSVGPSRFDPILLGETLSLMGAIKKSFNINKKRIAVCEIRMFDNLMCRINQQVDVPGVGCVQITAVLMGLWHSKP